MLGPRLVPHPTTEPGIGAYPEPRASRSGCGDDTNSYRGCPQIGGREILGARLVPGRSFWGRRGTVSAFWGPVT